MHNQIQRLDMAFLQTAGVNAIPSLIPTAEPNKAIFINLDGKECGWWELEAHESTTT